ncbi:MAG: DUF1565 domain-containing protein [Alkalibacterium sp.]|nr:DUF1565 domain-containing protein [Alkalibacterium sp.]
MVKTYHVAKNGSDMNEGTEEHPFLTISKAASLAIAGDTVIVHKGVYREWVDPQNPGLSNTRRITFEAAENEKVIIKGSEIIDNWENIGGTVWKAVVSNDVFNGFNPFAEEIFGDWLYATTPPKHLGDVLSERHVILRSRHSGIMPRCSSENRSGRQLDQKNCSSCQ